jgi:hypothetical protein
VATKVVAGFGSDSWVGVKGIIWLCISEERGYGKEKLILQFRFELEFVFPTIVVWSEGRWQIYVFSAV